MDASNRLKEINAAREQIGEEKYLSTDYGIKEAFKYGLCKELVLNDDYQNNLLEAKRFEKAIKEQGELARKQKLAQIEADEAAKEELCSCTAKSRWLVQKIASRVRRKVQTVRVPGVAEGGCKLDARFANSEHFGGQSTCFRISYRPVFIYALTASGSSEIV